MVVHWHVRDLWELPVGYLPLHGGKGEDYTSECGLVSTECTLFEPNVTLSSAECRLSRLVNAESTKCLLCGDI